MKRELSKALVECAGEILPESFDDFVCRKKSRSGLVFWNSRHAAEKLWLFVKVAPDLKYDGICVHLGWVDEDCIPDYIEIELRSFDVRDREVELNLHEFPIHWLHKRNLETQYEILPLPNTVEESMEYVKPIGEEKALSLVRAVLSGVHRDLDMFAISYFEWVVATKRAMACD